MRPNSTSISPRSCPVCSCILFNLPISMKGERERERERERADRTSQSLNLHFMSLLSKATSNRPVHRISNGQQCTPVNDEKVAIKHILQYRETKTKGRLKIYLASHCGNCGSSVCKQRTLYIKGILVDLKRPFLVHLIGLKQ